MDTFANHRPNDDDACVLLMMAFVIVCISINHLTLLVPSVYSADFMMLMLTTVYSVTASSDIRLMSYSMEQYA